MDQLIQDMLELHEKCSNGKDTWCSACDTFDNCYGYSEASWPCDTVEVIYKHYPELAEETK